MTTISQDLWLRGQAAQKAMLDIAAYNAAVWQTATLQALHVAVTAPVGFWSAMARASSTDAPVAAPADPDAPLPENVVPLLQPGAAMSNPLLLDAPRGGQGDDLTQLKGVGARLAQVLNEFGIYHFDQIATLNDDGIAWLSAQQKGFAMTCARHDLVGQARRLQVG